MPDDRAKLERLESQLAHTERIASLGRLYAGVAHELNNPLAAILANVEVAEEGIRRSLATGDRVPEGVLDALVDSRELALRIRTIIRDLGIFARVDDGKIVPVDLHTVAEAAIQIAWNELRHRTTLCRDYGPTPLVDASEPRCVQVVLNLLINAIHAIPEGARDNEIRVRIGTHDDGRALLEVTDTGRGIPKNEIAHIFDPFFTTKGGERPGLGLSLCHVFVREWGGAIEVESTEARGSTFRVLLPASPVPEVEAVAEAPPPDPAQAAAPRRARVLVIDDDHDVLRAVQRGLSLHHDVIAMDDATRSLRMLREGERFDVILCDLMMPRMSGVEFYEAVQTFAPELAKSIVIVTGGAFTPRTVEFLTRVRFVEKPLTLGALRAIIAAALGPTPRAG